MHRTGELYGHFQTLEQQKESATLGMWIFLATEILFFGGLFLTYTINRHTYADVFAFSSRTIDLKWGAINTVVLIGSSLTMAMSVWSAQVGKKKLVTLFLILTLVLGQRLPGHQGHRVSRQISSSTTFPVLALTLLLHEQSLCLRQSQRKALANEKSGTGRLDRERWAALRLPSMPLPALLLSLLRHDRSSRSAHDYRGWAAPLADQAVH